MSDVEAFRHAYAALNSAQRSAVDAIEGPVMVIAGPGTGKTQILALRIAHILEATDATPDSILALTFTESGSRAMRERLARYIGRDAYKVGIYTFHSFASSLIKLYPDAYPRVIGGRPITEYEKLVTFEEIINDSQVTLLRPIGNPRYYLSSLIRAVSTMKREYITSDVFSTSIANDEQALLTIPRFHEKGAHKGKERSEYQKKAKQIDKNRELLFVYRRYEALLSDRHLFDFDDMILETVRALRENESMLRDLQERYHYILADEHQDVNGSQNQILGLLASYHERPNLFVVGDEKQAIYRFQGASLENFLFFGDAFPGTTTVSLTENYRSGASILGASHALITAEAGPSQELRVPLSSARNVLGEINRAQFSHESIEEAYIVQTINEACQRGVPQNEIAVIVRTNAEVERMSALLRGIGVRVTASADTDILTHPLVVLVRELLTVLGSPEDSTALVRVLHHPYLGIAPDDIARLLSAQTHTTPIQTLVRNQALLTRVGVVHPETILRVSKLFDDTRTRMALELPHQTLQTIMRESGFFDYVLAHDPEESSRIVRRIYDEVERMVSHEGVRTLRDIATRFTRYVEHNLPLVAPGQVPVAGSVQVMTAHKAKGLEFSLVCVPHLVDGVWGGGVNRNQFVLPLTRQVTREACSPDDDDRRLLYVAMTRAKDTLFLTSSHTNAEGRELTPSRFLVDIPENYTQEIDTTSFEASYAPLEALVSKPMDTSVHVVLLETLKKRGISATALNNYLESPWEYLYRNVFRVPELKTLSLHFGTAIHAVLEYATHSATQTGNMPSSTELKSRLERELGSLPLSTVEYTQLHEKGLTSILGYVPLFEQSRPCSTREEVSFSLLFTTGIAECPEIILTGKLDRVDYDAEGNAVRVVDYKTGRPKTRGQIEGKTKDSNGNYKRQLTFYALLAELSGDERFCPEFYTLVFVEPDSKGVIREESFAITKDEITALKETIIAMVQSIVSGECLHAPCDPERTSYCNLVQKLLRTE